MKLEQPRRYIVRREDDGWHLYSVGRGYMQLARNDDMQALLRFARQMAHEHNATLEIINEVALTASLESKGAKPL